VSSNEALNDVAAMKHCLETSHAVKKVAMNGVAEAEEVMKECPDLSLGNNHLF